MPWPVYSERFLHHQAAGTWSFIVPAGKRAVITHLDAISAAAQPADVWVKVGPILCEYLQFPVAWVAKHVTMRVVAYQGEEVSMNLSVPALHATLGGYLLEDTSGHTGPPVQSSWKKPRDALELLPALGTQKAS